jgi:hypothetical protein
MTDHITRQKLARANLAGLVRLAKHLGLHGCACGAAECRQGIEEKVARAIERESMKRHKPCFQGDSG